MALCNCIRKIWRELFWAGETTTKEKSSVKESTEKGSDFTSNSSLASADNQFISRKYSAIEEDSDSYFWCHGIKFDSESERDCFELKMNNMHEAFEKELGLIKEQHRRLHMERQSLKKRMSEIEIAVRRDIAQVVKGRSTEDVKRLTEELQLLSEMEEVLRSLEKEQEELDNLQKCLQLEMRERTMYPEPVYKRPRAIEDAFSKQMKTEGGLRYRSKDNTTKLIEYHALPPPLSLNVYRNTADKKKT